MIGKKRLKKLAYKLARTDECGVKGCGDTDVEITEVLPLDPIDHESSWIALCPKHTVWAEERNAFAEQMYEELREARKEIGQEHMGQIQDLAMPQDGELREDILMGEIEESVVFEDAFEERPAELEDNVGTMLTGGDDE